MDYNRYSYYRANPFASNDFIPTASMNNRKKKQFPSQIPQGQQHLTSKPGKRIYKDKVQTNQIQKDNILNSPQRYPYQNRIAFDKNYRRNLDTIDIEGASSGTKVSQSIRNKHKALEQLRKRNQQKQIKNPIIGQSLDQVYEKKRRQLAEQIQKNIQMRKTKSSFNSNNQINLNNNNETGLQDSRSSKNNQSLPKLKHSQLQAQYQRYVSHNSNQKYHGIPPNSYEFQGFQRYRRPQGAFQTLDSYNNGRIPQHIPLQKPLNQHNRYHSIDINRQNLYQSDPSGHMTNYRGSSIESSPMAGLPAGYSKQPAYMNNSIININNRHRSNPEYIDNYTTELQKRVQQAQKNKQIDENIKNIYQNDRAQFRRHNPTNLSFNIAAKSALMGPIV